MMMVTHKKYQIIYADPPWNFGGGGVYQDSSRPIRKTSNKYLLVRTKDLMRIPVESITDMDCMLFMWTTDQHIPDALKLMESWGFSYCTVAFYWVKKYRTGSTCFNVGCWTMKSVEQVLLGTKGNPLKYKKRRNIKQLVEAERTVHSKKPDEVRRRIVELCGDLPRIELFARERVAGWDSIGYDIDGLDIRDSLKILLGEEI